MLRKLERMLWQQVREVVPSTINTAVLPVGTIEAHGAACLGTDGFIPADIGEYVCDRLDLILAPPVWYGVTKSLLAYPGSLTVTPEHLECYVFDLLKSFKYHRFERIIILNGHGGNNSALKNVAVRAYHELRLNIAVVHWWQLCGDITKEVYGGEGGHAGCDETGYVMAIDPTLADASYYSEDLVYEHQAAADVYPYPGSIGLYNDRGEGRPDFDAEKGKIFAGKVKEKVLEFVHYVLTQWDKNGF
jgi:creatinine amidohydrolase